MIIWDIVIWYSSSKITLAKARANAKVIIQDHKTPKNLCNWKLHLESLKAQGAANSLPSIEPRFLDFDPQFH